MRASINYDPCKPTIAPSVWVLIGKCEYRLHDHAIKVPPRILKLMAAINLWRLLEEKTESHIFTFGIRGYGDERTIMAFAMRGNTKGASK